MNFERRTKMGINELSNEMTAAQSIGSSAASVIVCVILIIAWWKLFEKAGEAGWKSLIPFYNTYTLVKIADGNGIKFLLLLIPVVNIIFGIILALRIAKAFGKSGGFALGLILLSPIFMAILGFSDSQYLGPQGK